MVWEAFSSTQIDYRRIKTITVTKNGYYNHNTSWLLGTCLMEITTTVLQWDDVSRVEEKAKGKKYGATTISYCKI